MLGARGLSRGHKLKSDDGDHKMQCAVPINSQRTLVSRMWPLRLGRGDLRQVATMRIEDPFANTTCALCSSEPVRHCMVFSLSGEAGANVCLRVCRPCFHDVLADLDRYTANPDVRFGPLLVALAKKALLLMDADCLRLSGEIQHTSAACAGCRLLAIPMWACTPCLSDFACIGCDARWQWYCAPCLLALTGRFRETLWRREAVSLAIKVAPLAFVDVPKDIVRIVWRLMCGLIDFEEVMDRAIEITGGV